MKAVSVSDRRKTENGPGGNPPPLCWTGKSLVILDQTLLPGRTRLLELETPGEVREAICSLRVRGAPAIGVAAARGLCLAAAASRAEDASGFLEEMAAAANSLNSSRPTAVNLAAALDRVLAACREALPADVPRLKDIVLEEAGRIEAEDRKLCDEIARHGFEVLARYGSDPVVIMTHCNAGALATAGCGTALGIITNASRSRRVRVYACETRPLLQGSRLTAWELSRAGVDVTVICDGMAASVMSSEKIDLVLVGADRIANNGDTANKVGTCSLAVLARHYGVPFFVAAPWTTLDLSMADGRAIPIEERPAGEIAFCGKKRIVPRGVRVYNPAFDVTPASLVTGFVTDRGVLAPPFENGRPSTGKNEHGG